MSSSFLWVKALHTVFVASWLAGLFYLPRLFVNLDQVVRDSRSKRERLLRMARRRCRSSGWRMVPAIARGIVRWLAYGAGRGPGNGWLHAKPGVVLAAIGDHHGCRTLLRGFEAGVSRHSDRWLRLFNELSVLLFAAAVALAVVKPF